MFEAKVLLNAIDKVKEFNNNIHNIDCDLDLVSGRYVIDAKSIMGTFSLDLSKPITFRAHTDDEDVINQVKEAAGKFFV